MQTFKFWHIYQQYFVFLFTKTFSNRTKTTKSYIGVDYMYYILKVWRESDTFLTESLLESCVYVGGDYVPCLRNVGGKVELFCLFLLQNNNVFHLYWAGLSPDDVRRTSCCNGPVKLQGNMNFVLLRNTC